MIAAILFYIAAAGLVASALGVVLSKSPLRAALRLIVALCCLALLYVLLEASFVAAMQILVYAGAIMVLFVFVIMLLNLQPGSRGQSYLSTAKVLGSLAAAYLFYVVARGALGNDGTGGGGVLDGSVKNVGRLLLTDYLFGFEAISIMLLVAVVGAVVLGLKRLT